MPLAGRSCTSQRSWTSASRQSIRLAERGYNADHAFQQLQPLLLQNIDILVAAVLIAGILVLLITTFFTAGAIGMAIEATKTGRTRLSDMTDYGARKFVSLLGAIFMAHKVDVFLLWLVVLVIAIVAGIILGNIPYIGQWISMAVSVLILQPLTVIWWSRLYLSEIEVKTT